MDEEVPDLEVEVQVSKSKEKASRSSSTHTTYAVSTRTSMEEFGASSFTVVRRYRDFLWLQGELMGRHPGIIVPPLPEKREYKKFDAFFLEYRRRGLQKFLRTIAAHPTLARSTPTIQFLESDTPLPSSKTIAKDILAKVSGFSMSRVHAASLQENTEFSQAQDELDHLKEGLKTTAAGLKAQARATVDVADVLDWASDEIAELAEVSNEPLSDDLTAFGEGLYKVSLIDRELSTSVFETFGATLGEYIRGSRLARATLVARAQAYIKWQETVSSLESKRSSLDKLKEKPGKEAAVAKTMDKIETLEGKVDDRRLKFDEITAGLQQELDRFHARRVDDMQHALVSLTQNSITSHQKKRAIFASILRSLEA